MSSPSYFAGLYNAGDFAYGINKSVPPLQVVNGPNATGSAALTVAFGSVATNDGLVFSPLNTNAPIYVGQGTSDELVTPTAVSNTTPLIYGTSSVTATYGSIHGTGDQIRSGTVGLQEALNVAGSRNGGGGVVIVDAGWKLLGGTDAMLETAVIPAGVSIQDNRAGGDVTDTTVALSATQVNTMFTTPVELLPPPAAGSFYVIQQAILVNENGGTAWTSGGAIEIGYGSSVTTQALSGTIAATFLTSPTVKQVITLAGAQLASSTESTYDAQGIYINNATGVFATGTGKLIVRLLYTLVKS